MIHQIFWIFWTTINAQNCKRERAAKKMHDDITSLKEQIRKLEKTVDYQEYTKFKDDNIDPRVLETINEY